MACICITTTYTHRRHIIKLTSAYVYITNAYIHRRSYKHKEIEVHIATSISERTFSLYNIQHAK